MRVLLTGASGFLGMEVLARLIEDGASEVVALVRSRDREHAAARLREVLGRLYERPPELGDRVLAVRGDLCQEGLGLSAGDARLIGRTVDAVLHCGASVAFDLPAEQAREVNVAGTRRMLELARRMTRLERLVHVSTAYVAGEIEGPFAEDDLARGQRFRNSYELSKFEAERLLEARRGELPLVIARPSIVVGDSTTGWTPSFNVIYWPLRAFARGLMRDAPVNPDGVLDVVTSDYVADALVELLRTPHDLHRVHLVAGRGAVSNGELVRLACATFDRELPSLARSATVPQQARPYLPYFDVRTRFDDRRAREALEPGGVRPVCLADCFQALIDYAQRTHWGKRATTREAAASRACS